jgi:hypothetical protein
MRHQLPPASAEVVESLIVVDRWLFLREHPNVVKQSWVEAVFDYQESPRNLVVVEITNGEFATASTTGHVHKDCTLIIRRKV